MTWATNPPIRTLLPIARALDAVVHQERINELKGPKGDPGDLVEVVAGSGIAVDNTDTARPVVSLVDTPVLEVQVGSGLLVNDADPQRPEVSLADDPVLEVQVGDGLLVDNTDPQRPIVSVDESEP